MSPRSAGRRLTVALMTTTALAGASALLIAGGAQASDECGAPVAGVVTCAKAGGPYAGGIAYVASGPLTVNLEDGTEASKVELMGDGLGALTLNARGADIGGAATSVGVLAIHSVTPASGTTTIAVGDVMAGSPTGQGVIVMGAYGVDISADAITAGHRGITIAPGGAPGAGGDVHVAFNRMDVNSAGSGAGVVGESFGDASILFGEMNVSGELTRGLDFKSHGDMTVRGASISTSGGVSGANVLTVGGDLDLFVETITTTGAEAAGLVVRANTAGEGPGHFNVNLGTVTTNGADATGVSVVNTGQVTVSVGSVRALGGGKGVEARGDAGVYVLAGEVETMLGDGVVAQAQLGQAFVEAGTIKADGADAFGIRYSARDGGRVTATRIETLGDDGYGLHVQSDGDVSAGVGSIETTGWGATGAYARAFGDLDLRFDTITTHGQEALGLEIRGRGDLTYVEAASIETFGVDAWGVRASHDNEGELIIDVAEVRTHGDGAIGVSGDVSMAPALTAGGAATLRLMADTVRTSGHGATGVLAAGHMADVAIDVGHVETEGDDAPAIHAAGHQLMDIKAESLVTAGDRSVGLLLDTPEATVTVQLGQVTTHGEASSGVAMADGVLADTISLIAGSIGTQGYDAYGLDLEAVETLTVEVGSIATTGDFGAGAVLGSNTLTQEIGITAQFGSIETAGFAATGLFARTTAGVDIGVGEIRTGGDHAYGAQVNTNGGAMALGKVTTLGLEAIGVYLNAGEADFDLQIGEVSTRGAGATGVLMNADGAMTAEIGKVLTEGENAVGVSMDAAGAVQLLLGQVRTAGDNAHGLRVAAQSAEIDLVGQVWTQGNADAVRVNAEDDLRVDFGGGVRADGGTAVRLSSGGAIAATVAAGAVVHGRDAGFDLDAGGRVTLENAGHIASDTDLAILVRNGALTLKNTGRITGRIEVWDDEGGDVIENAGEFVARGISDFGGGEDVFRNLAGGVFTVLEPQTAGLSLASAAAPTGTILVGLERFVNAGTVSLVNGVAGDSLLMDGVFVNQAGGVLQLDLDTTGASAVADTLDIGSLDGDLTVQLKVKGQGVVGDAGVTLLKSGGSQVGDELTVESLDGSFVAYTVTYDADSGGYGLIGDLAVQAYEPTKAATGAQALWRRGADVVSARLAQIRDDQAMARREAGKASVWVQAFSGREDVSAHRQFNFNNNPLTANLSHEIQTQGVQMGADVLLPFGGGDLVLGASGGLGQVEQTFDGNGDVSEFDSVSLGAYAQWFMGPWSFGVMVKHEDHDLTYRWTSADLRDEAGGETWGGRIEAAWRVQTADGLFMEPAASLSINETDLDGVTGDAGDVAFGSTRSVLGRIGLRAGFTRRVNGLIAQPYLGLHGIQEFDGRNVSRLTFGGDVFTVKDTGEEAWLEGVIGVNVATPSGLGGFIQAEGLTGGRGGHALRIGARYNW